MVFIWDRKLGLSAGMVVHTCQKVCRGPVTDPPASKPPTPPVHDVSSQVGLRQFYHLLNMFVSRKDPPPPQPATPHPWICPQTLKVRLAHRGLAELDCLK